LRKHESTIYLVPNLPDEVARLVELSRHLYVALKAAPLLPSVLGLSDDTKRERLLNWATAYFKWHDGVRTSALALAEKKIPT